MIWDFGELGTWYENDKLGAVRISFRPKGI